MTLLEVTVAASMLAVLLAMSVQMLRVVSGQQRTAERRILALQTVQAIAEQVGNTPWDQLTAQSTDQLAIPDMVAPHLPGARLAVNVEEETEPIAKRVFIELTWNGPGGQPAGPLRLTSWVFPDP